MAQTQLAPFLRGDIEGLLPLASVWLRNLQEVEETIEKWAADLEPDGFWWVPGESTNPIGGLVRHIGGASYRLWLRGSGQEIPDSIKIKPADEMALRGSPTEVLEEFAQRMRAVKQGLADLTEPDLERLAVFTPTITAKALYVFDHIAGHAQHHAGQIITTRKLWNVR
jgi:uncharacterized damage-inducible protein DinB